MKQKKYFILAAAAILMAACSENDIAEKQSPQVTTEQAVDFDAYLSRGTTRAGDDGVLTTTSLQNLGGSGTGAHGFGVFGYYTNGESYTGSSRPDFFYNQNVYYNSGWTYSPIKYWPNEFGGDAISDQVDRVTLFAYAPWVEVEPLTGLVKVETGKEFNKSLNITGMTRNNATGDPLVKYVSSLIAGNSVDLCYGVAAQSFTSSNSAFNKNSINQGYPYIDVVKPGIDANSKIKFDFKHATAQMVVTIDAKIVNLTDNSDNVDAANTRIWVRSVTFEGITQSGALNLNSTAESPNWYDVNGTSLITTGSLTVLDGRKDGREANEAASSETPATLNPTIVQSAPYSAEGDITATGVEDGVTKTTVNLFGKQSADGKIIENTETSFSPIFVIPTKEKMKVTIVYDVETADNNLATYLSDGSRRGSTIENRIYKTIDTFGYIEAGKCYTLNLHLGMRSVDFDAKVTAWQDMQADVDLPSNIQAYKVEGSLSKYNVSLGANVTSYEFAISGLRANEAISDAVEVTDVDNIISSITKNSANGAGIAKQSVTVAKNTTTKNRTASVRWYTPNTGNLQLDFTQMAHPLEMRLANWPYNTYLQLACSSEVEGSKAWGTDLVQDDDHIKLYKNGVKLIMGSSGDYTFEEASNLGRFILSEPAKTGDVFKIWIQSGDAPAEELTVTY